MLQTTKPPLLSYTPASSHAPPATAAATKPPPPPTLSLLHLKTSGVTNNNR
jgi:hypothetical protein